MFTYWKQKDLKKHFLEIDKTKRQAWREMKERE